MSIFTQEALSLAPWSVSKAETAVKCPLKFKHQYLDKTQVPKDKQPELSDSSLKIGSAVHYYAELLARNLKPAEAEKRVLEKHSMLSTEQEEFELLKNGVEDFQSRVVAFKQSKGFDQDLIEKKLAISHSLDPVDYWDKGALLRWVVDRALISKDGRYAIILDIKTGKSASLKWSRDQLNAYIFGALSYWPKVEMVQCALYFVPDRQLLWDDKVWRKDYNFGQDNPTVSLLNKAAEEAALGEFREGKHCSWCTYRLICPRS
jgi:RecB family exonuclease